MLIFGINREQIPGMCWSSLCLQLCRASCLPCQCLQTNTSCALKNHNWQIQENTDAYKHLQEFTTLFVDWINESHWLFPDILLLFSDSLGRLWIHHSDRTIHIYLRQSLLAERQDNFSVKSIPNLLIQLRSILFGKYHLYLYCAKLFGIENHETKSCLNSKISHLMY